MVARNSDPRRACSTSRSQNKENRKPKSKRFPKQKKCRRGGLDQEQAKKTTKQQEMQKRPPNNEWQIAAHLSRNVISHVYRCVDEKLYFGKHPDPTSLAIVKKRFPKFQPVVWRTNPRMNHDAVYIQHLKKKFREAGIIIPTQPGALWTNPIPCHDSYIQHLQKKLREAGSSVPTHPGVLWTKPRVNQDAVHIQHLKKKLREAGIIIPTQREVCVDPNDRWACYYFERHLNSSLKAEQVWPSQKLPKM